MRKAIAVALAVVCVGNQSLAQSSTSCALEVFSGRSISTASVSDPWTGPVTIAASGLSGGAGLGCDVRMQRVIVGALARYEVADIASKIGAGSFATDGQWTVAARGGVYLSEGALVYGLAGLTGTDFRLAGNDLSGQGLLVGGGLEVAAFSPSLAFFAEYTRAYAGKDDVAGVTVRPSTDAARVGLRWRFWSSEGGR